MMAHQLRHLLRGHLQTNRLVTVIESVDGRSIVFLSHWKVRLSQTERDTAWLPKEPSRVRVLTNTHKYTETDSHSSAALNCSYPICQRLRR